MKREEAVDAAKYFFGGYPNLKPSPDSIAVFVRAFLPMTQERADEVIARAHMQFRKFPPNIGQLTEMCMQQAGGRKTGEEAYAELMLKVRTHGRCYGPSDPPPKLDPIATKALGVWGAWNDVCNAPDDDAAGRARFIALYDQLAERGTVERVVPPGRQLGRGIGVVRQFPQNNAARRSQDDIASAGSELEGDIERERQP